MSTSNWISRKVGKLMPGKNVGQDAPQAAPDAIEPASSTVLAGPGQADTPPATPGPAAPPTVTGSRRSPRSTTERLKATFRQDDEALSPREMRHKLAELQAVVDSQVSEVEGGRRARLLALWYTAATPAPSLWRDRDFNIYWLGQTLSGLGDAFAAIALPLLVLQSTGSLHRMGRLTALVAVAHVVAGLASGALVDRVDRRVIGDHERMVIDPARLR